jgi:Mrp family chromosome partitioning ATPase
VFRPAAVAPAAVPASGKAIVTGIPALHLDRAKLEDSRIVSYRRDHPSHVAFDMLRTKIAHAMASNGWTSIGITSPSPDCGKSVVALNLAFSMAHQPDRTVVLVDLDLRSPGIADLVGCTPKHNLEEYLKGEVDLVAVSRRAGENLILCINGKPVSLPAEWIRDEKISKMPTPLRDAFGAKIIIFDLPPALTNDDVMVFCPYVDCAILVAAAGKTTAREIEESERQLTLTNYLGVVLNKAVGSDTRAYGENAYTKRQVHD